MFVQLISVFLRQGTRFLFSFVTAILIVSQAGVTDLARAALMCDTANYDGFFLGPDGKTTYAVTTQPLTWQDAQTLAQSSGGRLVVITDQTQNDALAQNFGQLFTPAPFPSSGNKAWIGLYDTLNTAAWCMEGQPCVPMPQRFSWANGFSSFTNYSSGEPNGLCTNAERTINPDHNCYGEPWIAMSASGTWSDEGNHGTAPITLKGIVEWPQQTLDCVKVSTPPYQAPDTPLPDTATGALWCTNSQQNNLMQCLDTTDGNNICPLDQQACQISCPSGYAYNGSSSQCEAAVGCPSGSTFNSVTSRCEMGAATTTGYALPAIDNQMQISKYELRNHFATGTSDFLSTPPTIDAVRFTFGVQNSQVALVGECAWGMDGNCGCSSPNWDSMCYAGTSISNAMNGTTLTSTAAMFDFGSNGLYFIPGASAMADISEFFKCPSGYTSSSPPTPAQCQSLLSQWGAQTGLSDCTQSSSYVCSAPINVCPAGFTLSGSLCYQNVSCPSGGSLQGGTCAAAAPPAACPGNSALPCKTVAGDTSGATYCSPNACLSTTAAFTTGDDTQSGLNDKTNDGPKGADGTCLGQIYLFNGNDLRCRLYDRWGMVNSYAKLVGEIVLAATGAGAALAGALAVTGSVGTALVNAAVEIATNVCIDGATGQLNSGTLIQAGTSLVAAGVGGYLSAGGDTPSMFTYNPYGSTTLSVSSSGFSETVNDSLASLGNPFTLSQYGQQVLSQGPYQQFMSQLQIISDQYSPAITNGMLGNYTETKCCYPDKLSAGCEKDEIKEAGMAGNGECHIVGTYCASKMLSACMVSKQTSCCFSSRLARIIQEQGRLQLADFGPSGGWGDARSPICRGFTVNEFQNLDFSAMDLSEFTNDITARMQNLSPLLQNYMSSVGQQTEGLLKASPNLPQGAQ